ncbi:MAG: ABC transporter permease [Chloroflexota bacterium]
MSAAGGAGAAGATGGMASRTSGAKAAVAAFSGTLGIAVLAILITLILTAPLILAAGASPIDAYLNFFITPLTSQFRLLEVLVSATPILFTGVAVAIAFRSGYWNIGAEGQLLMGAVAATFVGMNVEGWSPLVAIPLMILAGALAGAAWAFVPGILRVRLGIDEVVTTLLLNPVALLVVKGLVQGPWRNPDGITESPPIAAAAEFPTLLAKSRLHLGFILAVVILLIAWYVLSRTATGLRLRAVGLSPHAARFAGIRVERSLLMVALVSGAIAGMAGVSEVAGIQGRLTPGLSSGAGYTGIVVAMLGGLSMPGVLGSALLLGDLNVGTNSAERALGIPSQVGDVVQGTLLLVVVGLLAIRRWRVHRSDRPADESEPPPDDERHVEGAPG